MHLAFERLGVRAHLWMEEFEAFPPFRAVGALPFPKKNSEIRVQTMRRSIRALRSGERSLLIFPEGRLHEGPGLLPFERSAERLAAFLPERPVIPVAIATRMGIHERPSAHITFGSPVEARSTEAMHAAVEALLRQSLPPERPRLLQGTADVNQRYARKQP